MATIELPANVWTAAAVIAGSADVDHRNSGAAPYRLAVSATTPTSTSDGEVFASGERGDLTLSDATVWALPLNDRTGQITVETRQLGVFAGVVTPQRYAHLVVDDDWAPAFEAAFAASKIVHVPAGNYTFKTQMAFQQEGQVLYGPSPRPNAVQSAAGAKLVYHADLGSTPLLHLQYSGQVANLAFDGPGKGTGIAMIARKPTDYGAAYEDTDVEVTECSIDGWHTAIQHWNRGLRFINNNVSLCTRAVELEGFDTANFVDDPANPFDALAQGFRSIVVCGNRMHAIDICVRNEGLNKGSLRGFELCGNVLDIGDGLFDGGLASGRIGGNNVDQSSAAYVIRFTTAVEAVVIDGNYMRGDLVQGIPARFIEFAAGCERLSMTGNAMRGASSFGVYLSAGVLSGLITGNVIDLENNGDATDACIRADTNADFTNLAITGNYLNAASGSPLIRGSAASDFTGVVIEGNAGNRSRTLVSNFVDGGGNLTQSW